MLDFLRYVLREARWYYGNKRGIFDITRRAGGIEIRQGVTVINPDRLQTPGPLRIESGCFLHCGGNAWSRHQGHIRFGKGCWVAQNAILYGAGGIDYGDYVGTGPGAMVFSSRDDYGREHSLEPHIVHKFAPVRIGSYVRIFAGVVVGPGVTIGEGCVIGAGSIVLGDLPPWSIAAGVPARVVGPRDRDSMDSEGESVKAESSSG